MKANDLGKLGAVKRSARTRGNVGSVDLDGPHARRLKRESKEADDDDDEPWLKRLNKKPKAAKVIELSDDE